MSKENILWQPMLEILLVIVAVVSVTVPLYVHTDNKLHIALDGVRQDMMEFHARLERQDAEFKAHMIYYHQAGEKK